METVASSVYGFVDGFYLVVVPMGERWLPGAVRVAINFTHPAKRLLFSWCLVAVWGLALIRPTTAAPVYNVVPLGFDDLEHTRDDGYKFTIVNELNEAGQVSGVAYRFDGSGSDLGQSAWLFNGTTAVNIGLTGSDHTRNDGYRYSDVAGLSEAGHVWGSSKRFSGGNGLSNNLWVYNGVTTIIIGLTDSEHTRNDGYQHSLASLQNEAGQVSGFSDSFIDAIPSSSAWLYDGATTIKIGLTDIEHTTTSGSKDSNPKRLNEAGQVCGNSKRYNGSNSDLGRSAWLYNGTNTIGIGLTGSEHTRNDGYRFSETYDLNEAGQVTGFARRFNGGNYEEGRSAWFYNGSTTNMVGLTDSEHTRNDGYKYSFADRLNEAGQVTGYSERYIGGATFFGRSAWLYNGVTTINIGLTGPEHTRNDGYKYSSLVDSSGQLSETGRVLGQSRRYNGGNIELGQSAWLYDGANTIEIGLTGSEHTKDDGARVNFIGLRNEVGQVIGYANRYNGGSTRIGFSAWIYDGTTTHNIGLTGAEHTRSDDHKESFAFDLNEEGQVRGTSQRFNGSMTQLGQSAWLYDGASTIDIGLVGSEHTRNDDYKFSETEQLNEAGQVVGYSYRYNGGGTQLGQDAWLYDQSLAQTFSLNLSTRSDGYAFSSADYLGEDGLVLGTYTLFDELDNDLGPRAFYFTIADGLHDLGSLVDGGLAANGWNFLADTLRANGQGQILGRGKLTSQSGGQMAYLLTPVIPEPSSLLLAGLGFLGLVACIKRRRC